MLRLRGHLSLFSRLDVDHAPAEIIPSVTASTGSKQKKTAAADRQALVKNGFRPFEEVSPTRRVPAPHAVLRQQFEGKFPPTSASQRFQAHLNRWFVPARPLEALPTILGPPGDPGG